MLYVYQLSHKKINNHRQNYTKTINYLRLHVCEVDAHRK